MAAELVLLSLVVISLLAEYRLSQTWNRTYWSRGIVVFRSSCRVLHPRPTLPRIGAIELRLMETELPSLDFKKMANNRFAFQENYTNARVVYTQIMRGNLTFDPVSGSIEVVGMVNYFAVGFVAVALWGASTMGLPEGVFLGLAFLGVIAACYFTQAKRYYDVLTAVAAEWGEQPELSSSNAG